MSLRQTGSGAGEGTRMAREPAWPAVQRDQRPWTRWWWPGSAVDRKNLTRELEAFRAAGFGGVEITPIYGAKGAEARYVTFMSDRWLALMRHACLEARRLGLGVDIVAGTGWRMGGAGVPPAERAVRLKLLKRSTPSGVRYVAKAEPSGEPVKRAAPGGEGHSLDMFDAKAVGHWVERFNRRFFRAIPAGLVRAQFHDSWEYEANWSRGLLAEFKRRRGYDLRNHLAVFDPGAGAMPAEMAARVRHDYRLTMEEMLLENFVGTWSGLCHQYGIRTRNQGHGSPANLLDVYARADIPETEIIWDGTDPLVQKFVSSAGHVAGRPLISSESYTWLAEHWCEEPGKIKRYTDYLFLCGVNHLVYHGTAYSPAGVEWPGWYFYAATQVNDRNPLWRIWPALNRYIGRCQSFLQAGVSDNPVLLYWPISDATMTAGGPYLHGFVVSSDRWTHGEALHKTARALWERGVLFDYVSDRQLQSAGPTPEGVSLPGGTFRCVVLPPLTYMLPETARALCGLARAGVPVIGGGDPAAWDVPGLANLARRRRDLRRAVRELLREPAFLKTGTPERRLEVTAAGGEAFQATTGLRCIRRRLEGGETLYFIANRADRAFDGRVTLNRPGRFATLRDPWSGRAGVVEVRAKGLRLQLQPQQSILVVLSATRPAGSAWVYGRAEPRAAVPVRGPWRVSFMAGGPTRPKPRVRKQLGSITAFGDPELERFAGTVRYATRVDAPGAAGSDLWLDLGDVRYAAQVRFNGHDLGAQVMAPYRFRIPGRWVRSNGNRLVVDVTTLGANRIRDLDRRGVDWKIFHDINLVTSQYKPFDASGWALKDGGLLGPVTLMPEVSTP